MTHPFNGLVIGQAGQATRALLDRLLEENGTSFPHWVTLFLVAHPEDPPLVDRVAVRLKIDHGEAAALLGDLAADGLLDGDQLTPAGQDRYQRISDGVQAIADHLYGDIPADERTVAGRLLALVTERATAALAV